MVEFDWSLFEETKGVIYDAGHINSAYTLRDLPPGWKPVPITPDYVDLTIQGWREGGAGADVYPHYVRLATRLNMFVDLIFSESGYTLITGAASPSFATPQAAIAYWELSQ